MGIATTWVTIGFSALSSGCSNGSGSSSNTESYRSSSSGFHGGVCMRPNYMCVEIRRWPTCLCYAACAALEATSVGGW